MPSACITRMVSEAGASHKLTGSRKSAKYAVYAAVFIPTETLTILNGDGKTPAADFEVDSRPVVIPSKAESCATGRASMNGQLLSTHE